MTRTTTTRLFSGLPIALAALSLAACGGGPTGSTNQGQGAEMNVDGNYTMDETITSTTCAGVGGTGMDTITCKIVESLTGTKQ